MERLPQIGAMTFWSHAILHWVCLGVSSPRVQDYDPVRDAKTA